MNNFVLYSTLSITTPLVRGHLIKRETVKESIQNNKELSNEALEQVALRFKLLSDPMRLKILHALQDGEKSVNQLVNITGSSQPNISKHLNILRTSAMVRRRQESNQAFFSISAPFIFELCDIVCNGIAEELEQLKSNFT